LKGDNIKGKKKDKAFLVASFFFSSSLLEGKVSSPLS